MASLEEQKNAVRVLKKKLWFQIWDISDADREEGLVIWISVWIKGRVLKGQLMNTKVIQKRGMKTVTTDDMKKSEMLKVREDPEIQRENLFKQTLIRLENIWKDSVIINHNILQGGKKRKRRSDEREMKREGEEKENKKKRR